MGLERVAYLLQGVDNMYEIDVMYPVIEKAEELTGKRYGDNWENDVRFRVVADHVRSTMMLISDGVTPGNEGRGYVLRRLLRRAVRSMRLLGTEDRVLPELLPVSRDKMGETYAELHRDWDRISQIAYAEEDAFRQTLKAGTQIFDLAAQQVKQSGGHVLSGDRAFALHDTYGFPIDLTLEMAAEQGLEVDEVGFRDLMNQQRQRAKADAAAKKGGARRHHGVPPGRRRARPAGRVHRLPRGRLRGQGARAGLGRRGRRRRPARATSVELVLDRTPFYAEGGGQLADQGVIELGERRAGRGPRRADADHRPGRAPGQGARAARSRVGTERALRGRRRAAQVDLARAHRDAHGAQGVPRGAGRDRDPGGLRERAGPVPVRLLRDRRGARRRCCHDVEARVNDLVLADLGVHAELMTQEEAVKSGAMALFGEKYGDQVRVISVGDWARELCGGTHAGRSGQLGVVKLLGEASIGSGVRRVEALVGADAYQFLAREHVLVSQLSEALKARPEELPERVNDIVERLRAAEKEIEKHRVGQVLAAGGSLAAGAPGRPRRAGRRPAGRRRVRRRRAHAGAGRARTAARAPAGRGGRHRGHRGRRRHQGLRGGGGQRRRAGRAGSAPTPWSARSGRSWAAAAAARTTSRRAAAADAGRVDEALDLVRSEVARAIDPHGQG